MSLKKLVRALLPNPLDRLLKKAECKGQKRILLFWNRGLGDIALGLYAIVHKIYAVIPDARIVFVTRPNLVDGFALLENVEVIGVPGLQRGQEVDLGDYAEEFDLIIPRPDPTYWVSWQLGTLTPRLHWKSEWEPLWQSYGLSSTERYIGMHVQTETNYASWRNWPLTSWERLFKLLEGKAKVLLFGFEKEPHFDFPHLIDLRGKTPLFSLLSIIKNRCSALVVPDSGISAMTYFLDSSFPLQLVSLWGRPHMGILKQNVPSPNPLLRHVPLIGSGQKIENISPEQLFATLHIGGSF